MRVRAPGDTVFTVIPCSRPWRASDNVADHTAALAAPYPIAPPPGMRSSSATSETVFTMRPRLRAEMRPRSADRADGADEVHREHTLELLGGDRLDRTGASFPTTGEAGVVHDDVELPERVDRALDRVCGALERRDVAVIGDGVPSRGLDLRHHRVGDRRVAALAVELGTHVAHHDPRAARSQQQRMRTTDAASPAGHNGHPAVEALSGRSGHRRTVPCKKPTCRPIESTGNPWTTRSVRGWRRRHAGTSPR